MPGSTSSRSVAKLDCGRALIALCVGLTYLKISKIWGGQGLESYTSNSLTRAEKYSRMQIEVTIIWAPLLQRKQTALGKVHFGRIFFPSLLLWCTSAPLAPCHVIWCPLNSFGAQMSKNILQSEQQMLHTWIFQRGDTCSALHISKMKCIRCLHCINCTVL